MYHYYIRYSGINNYTRRKVDGAAELILREPITSIEQIKEISENVKRGKEFKDDKHWEIFIDFYEFLRKDN